MITVGKAAPAFSLLDQDEKKRTLGEFKGQWVVLYFYPRDDTPGCTIEACEFTEGIRGFGKLDAEVIGCSPDDPATHRKFIQKYKLKLTLLSDPEHEAMEAYGAWGDKVLYGRKFKGVIRSTVIVDPAGKVAYHWKKVKAKGHAESVRARLAELQSGKPEKAKKS
ncbi:MAG TPA: peroxiredoxin [Planctomycetota bacterium]|jgi:peroxiredoxin Q/BCP|nr:peroxiredoxin [Planctomycetota bacterium]